MMNVEDIKESDLVVVEEKENKFKKCEEIVKGLSVKDESGYLKLSKKRSEVIDEFMKVGLSEESAKNYYYLIVNKGGKYKKEKSKKVLVEEFMEKFGSDKSSKFYVKNFMKCFDMSEMGARTYLNNFRKSEREKNKK